MFSFSAPEGPPLDMQLEALTSQSIKVTWKVRFDELATYTFISEWTQFILNDS